MPFPASLTLITITGTFLDLDGEPRAGEVTITLPTPIYSSDDNVVIPHFVTDPVELDDNGSFSVELPATTDPEWLPNTVEYIVQAVFTADFHKLWWQFPAPYDAAGATIDVADVGAPSVGTPSATVRQGVIPSTHDGSYKGTWAIGTAYRAGDTVQHGSSVYGALKASTGVTPGTAAATWKVYPSSGGGGGAVSSVFGRDGDVVAVAGDYALADITGLSAALALKAPLASPTFTGTVTAATIAATSATVGGQAVVVTNDARLSDTRVPTDGSVTTAKIVDSNVTLAKLANIAASTILGNNTGGAVAPIALTAAQVKALLAIAQSDVTGLTAALALLAPLASPALTGTATAVNLTVSGRLRQDYDTLTDAATIATDASLGDSFTVTLGGNRTLGNPTNAVDGQRLFFRIRQDGTGGRTLALDTKFRDPAGYYTGVDTAIGARSYLGCVYDATDDQFDVLAFVEGY